MDLVPLTAYQLVNNRPGLMSCHIAVGEILGENSSVTLRFGWLVQEHYAPAIMHELTMIHERQQSLVEGLHRLSILGFPPSEYMTNRRACQFAAQEGVPIVHGP